LGIAASGGEGCRPLAGTPTPANLDLVFIFALGLALTPADFAGLRELADAKLPVLLIANPRKPLAKSARRTLTFESLSYFKSGHETRQLGGGRASRISR
jgi:hypothetical protein